MRIRPSRPFPSRNGWDRFELVVHQGDLDEQRHGLLMDEPLEVPKRVGHEIGRRWHEHGVVQRGAADPYRALSQLAGLPMTAPHSLQQALVHLAHESYRDREAAADAGQAVLQRHDVVGHLPGVRSLLGRDRLVCLQAEQLRHVRLGSLDPRAEHRLDPQMGSDQQVRVGKEQAHPAEPVDGGGRPVEQPDCLSVEVEAPRQGFGMKRPVPLHASEDSASVCGLERLRPHARPLPAIEKACFTSRQAK